MSSSLLTGLFLGKVIGVCGKQIGIATEALLRLAWVLDTALMTSHADFL
jgi:uncharacterized membrane protein (UPF0136 family)